MGSKLYTMKYSVDRGIGEIAHMFFQVLKYKCVVAEDGSDVGTVF